MSSASTLSKLAQLRAKTDQELVAVIDGELDRGLHFALLADKTKSNSPGSVETPHRKAETAYAEGVKLLSKVDDPSERRRLEGKLKQLRAELDRPSISDGLRLQVACSRA